MEFRTELSLNGKRLANRVIKSIEVADQELCGSLCFMEPNCASYNFKTLASPSGDHRCELNNATHEGHEDELEENPNYLYLGAKVRINKSSKKSVTVKLARGPSR